MRKLDTTRDQAANAIATTRDQGKPATRALRARIAARAHATVLTLALAIATIISAPQAKSAAEPPLDCAKLKEKLEHLNPQKKPWNEVVVAKTDLATALHAIVPLHTPSKKALDARLADLQQDIERHFPLYLRDNYANCTMRRAELRMALVNTAISTETTPKEKAAIADQVANSIRSESKFPTLISALADARVLEFAATHKLWATGKLDAITQKKMKIETELAEENKIYGEPWARVTAELEKMKTDEERTQFLRKSPDFKKLRAHIMAEPSESAAHLKELRALAE